MTSGVSFTPQESFAALLDRSVGTFAVIEALLAIAVLATAFLAPNLGKSFFDRVEKGVATLAHSRLGQIIAVGIFAVVARGLFLPWLGAPVPISHDEHSFVLQAQTYLAGRLVNPTHPFWEHFESIHINQLPAYASMYFPGRGAPLAAGLLLADHAWVGVWLSFVIMCMAAVWMLQAWVAPPHALLGGVLVVIRLGMFSYWINSYWGGAFIAFGAMLILGAFPRILRRPSWSHGVLMGVGAVILMVNRPYEGALLCAPIGVVLLIKLLRAKGNALKPAMLKVGVPAVCLLAAGGALMLAYNDAATGDPLTAPYSLNRETYAITPAFLTSPPIEGQRRGPEYFRAFYEWEDVLYQRRGSASQLSRGVLAKAYYSWNFYIGLILTFAFIAGLWAGRREYVLPVTLGFFFLGFSFQTWHFPHYAAPLFPVLLIVTMKGFEWLRHWTPGGRNSGLFLTRAMPAACLAAQAVPAAAVVSGWPAIGSNHYNRPCCAVRRSTVRTEIGQKLLNIPGDDLIMVTSDRSLPIHTAVVYNDPDIDSSDIVWASRLSPEKDARLRAYFVGRKAWQLDWNPDESYVLRPLPPVKPVAGGDR